MVRTKQMPQLVGHRKRGQRTRVNHRERIRRESARRDRHHVGDPSTARILIDQHHDVRAHRIPNRVHLVDDAIRRPCQCHQRVGELARLHVVHLTEVDEGEADCHRAVHHCRVRIRNRGQDLRLDSRYAVARPGRRAVNDHEVHDVDAARRDDRRRKGHPADRGRNFDRFHIGNRRGRVVPLEEDIAAAAARGDLEEDAARVHGPVNHSRKDAVPHGEGRPAERLSRNPTRPHPVAAAHLADPVALHAERLTREEGYIERGPLQNPRIHLHAADPSRNHTRRGGGLAGLHRASHQIHGLIPGRGPRRTHCHRAQNQEQKTLLNGVGKAH